MRHIDRGWDLAALAAWTRSLEGGEYEGFVYLSDALGGLSIVSPSHADASPADVAAAVDYAVSRGWVLRHPNPTLAGPNDLLCASHFLHYVNPKIRGSPLHPGGLIRGVTCLKSFIGDDSWCLDRLQDSLRDHLTPISTLTKLHDSDRSSVALQGQLLLLRWCATSSPNYWLRTMPPHITFHAIRHSHRPVEGALWGQNPKNLNRQVRKAACVHAFWGYKLSSG